VGDLTLLEGHEIHTIDKIHQRKKPFGRNGVHGKIILNWILK
jgi:hypothetical protein